MSKNLEKNLSSLINIHQSIFTNNVYVFTDQVISCFRIYVSCEQIMGDQGKFTKCNMINEFVIM